jgi:hypothetical protein
MTGVRPTVNLNMKTSTLHCRSYAICTLACSALTSAAFGQATPILPPPVERPALNQSPAGKINSLTIRGGTLPEAVELLSHFLDDAKVPQVNVIFSPETRSIQVPDLALRNVNGQDALRLIAASAGCDLEAIPGSDAQTIGYRIYQAAPAIPSAYVPEPAPPAVNPAQPIPAGIGGPPVGSGAPAMAGGPFPGMPGIGRGMSPGPNGVVGFGPGPSLNQGNVRVYSLGSITNTVKFADVEKTLSDLLKSAGISSDSAKLGFHEKTNVLVVTADQMVHDLVNQYLEALQRNVAAANAEGQRNTFREEMVEAKVRIAAEAEQRASLMKQMEDTEQRLRETQRELDRLRATVPKTP